MRNICMKVNYDGTDYFGFQTQPIGNTIQDRIEEAIKSLTGEAVKIHASGRTDAGVHAIGQVFHFHTESMIPIDRWCMALNGRLPEDIILTDAYEVPLEFHSRRSAKRKTYRYTINANQFLDLFNRRTQLHHPGNLDIQAMRESLPYLLGTHDFTSFASRHSTKQSHIRTLYEAELTVDSSMSRKGHPRDQGVIHLFITGNGFLQHMVRIIVGTMLEVGEGKRKPEEMKLILEAEDRSAAGPTAVSKGLMLWNVEYEDF
ncbi:tRNA pseudouridine(38-40) synthase TruA [Paenibacillus urinalis]|uniref:tRNA pseudouridine synthase A n=1 Tax=Paenibacillus urinalis TaxID=521520 RepID=A0ABY7X7S6_9BACL|nr:tRNA pseudouridine(38-40) synthase TruA [Paenibacillus urinalis]WDH98179.1 tRNA pseudouridine(38-40) synthase TruA [Paenibacillus urinalis]WDI01863.1 tRNA pseudouridine(38-40) synthase TruA [Paenibacillus urinalis]